MVRDHFASLPPDQFPNIPALTPSHVDGERRRRFEFGLDLLLRGLAAYAN